MLSSLKQIYKQCDINLNVSGLMHSKRLATILTLLVLLSIILLNPFKANASSYSDQAVNLINQERQKAGLMPFNNSDKLTQASSSHNSTMFSCSKTFGVTACFSHQVTQLGEPNFFDRIKATGYNPQSASENIAWGYTSPAYVVNAWMGSSGHKANILGNYKDIGCSYLDGLSGSYQGMYWTCDFGTSFIVQSASAPTPTAQSPQSTPTPTPTKTQTLIVSPTPTPYAFPTPTPQLSKPWWCVYIPDYPLCR